MTAQTILPANTLSSGYDVDNSLRFNDGSSDYLNRTPGSASSRRTITFSCWFKKGLNAATWSWLMHSGASNDGTPSFGVGLKSDSLSIIDLGADGAYDINFVTNRKFRDPSAWFHVVVAIDTTQGTESNRVKIYVNGVQETSFSTATYPGENHDFNTGPTMTNYAIEIGRDNYGGGEGYYDGYMAEMALIDGSQLAPTSFGEFDEDSGIWKPIDVSGLTFGTNGFYLDFEDSSNLGNDANGGTDFTEVNIAAIDQSTDTCTNNMPVINQLTLHSNNVTISEGNLVATTGDAPWQSTNCTFGLTTGKWYWEFKATESSNNQYLVLGIQSENLLSSAAGGFGYSNNYSYGFKNYNGEFVYNESDGGTSASYGNAVTDGQIIGVALDLVNLEIYFSINGTFQNSGDPTSGSSGTGSAGDLQSGQTYFPSLVIARAGGTGTIPIGEYNFGSPPYSESGGNSDGAGYGNFAAAPPSGYFSINTKNLAEYGG